MSGQPRRATEGSANGLRDPAGHILVLEPPSESSEATLTQAGGVLWLATGRDYTGVRLNHRHLFEPRPRPVFDGDVITMHERSATIRL